MKQYFSAGGVLVNDQNQVYLIYKKARDEWLLPKGTIEKGETKLQTAQREIKEETGYQKIKPLYKTPVHTATWTFIREDTGDKEQKTTYYFLFKLLDSKQIQTKEVQDEGLSGDWFILERAKEKVAFGNLKTVLQKAKQHLATT